MPRIFYPDDNFNKINELKEELEKLKEKRDRIIHNEEYDRIIIKINDIEIQLVEVNNNKPE